MSLWLIAQATAASRAARGKGKGVVVAARGGAGGPTLLRKAHVQLARALDVPREVELQRAVAHAHACRRAGREVGHAGVGEYATWLGLG